MMYAVEMGWGSMIEHLPTFMTISLVFQKLRGIHTEPHREQYNIITLFHFTKQGKWAKRYKYIKCN
jgi:hypothetical protein